MSFLPVSEALLKLEHEGLLESRPRAGTRVRIPTRADVEGHYVVREALESQAAMLFAASATREERAEMLKLAARVDALASQPEGNRMVYLGLHEKLHRRIAECARCHALADAIARSTAMASIWLSATRAASRENPPANHESMVKLVAASDPDIAASAMREHIRASRECTLTGLAPYFQLQNAQPETYIRAPKKRIVFEKLLATALVT